MDGATGTGHAGGIIERARRIMAQRRLRFGLGLCLLTLLGGALAVVAADALFDLTAVLRATTPWLLIGGCALAAAGLLVWQRWLRPDEATGRRLAERALGDRDRQLTATLQLDAMAGELAQAGARRKAASLPQTPLQHGLPRLPIRGVLSAAGFVVLAAIALGVALPRLYPTVLPRLLDPSGDHPPYAGVVLSWDQAPGRVRTGDEARFTVAVADGDCERVTLIARDDDARVTSVPMYRIGRDTWAGEFDAVPAARTVWAEGGGTRTHRHRLEIDPIPVLAHLDLTAHPPSYARLADDHSRFDGRRPLELAALPGTRFTLHVASNRPLAAVRLQPTEAEDRRSAAAATIELPLVDGAGVVESLAPGGYEISLIASDGVAGHPIRFLDLEARVDQPPQVAVVQPSRDAVATIGEVVALELRADDDLGLARVERIRLYNGLPAPELAATLSATREWRWNGELDLRTLGVRSGDLISIGVVARDTHPPSGGQLSSEALRQIRIISEEEYNQMVLRRLNERALRAKYREVIERLRELERQAAGLAAQPASPERDRQLDEFARQARELAATVQAMHRDAPLFEIEPELQQALQAAAEALAQAAEDRDTDALARPGTAEMLDADLALLTDMARAQGLLARLRQLVDAEQQTSLRLAELAEHRRPTDADRVRLRERGDQEQELAAGIETWGGLARRHRDHLREQAASGAAGAEARSQAAAAIDDLASAVDATDAVDLKRQSARAARAGDGVEAHRLAALARDRLLALLPQIQRCQGQCSGSCSGFAWSSCRSTGRCLARLGGLAGRGMGMGIGGSGLGALGAGLALGYGGDDNGMTDPSAGMSLYGPENFGDLGGMIGDDGRGDGIAALAADGDGGVHAAAAHERDLRSSTATSHSHLGERERSIVDRYFRLLEETP